MNSISRVFNSTLFRSASVYTVSNATNSAIPFLLLPVLTRYLPAKDYGIVAMFSVVTAVINAVIGIGITGAITRRYYDLKRDEFANFMGNCLWLFTISSTIAAIVVLALENEVTKAAAIPAGWVELTVLVALCQCVCNMGLAFWQVRIKPLQYGLFQIGLSIANFSLSLILVIPARMGWEGRLIGQAIATGVFAIVSIYILHQCGWLKFRANWVHSKWTLKYGLPLVPHALGGIVIAMTDRVAITNLLGVSETGRYAVAVQFAMVINLFLDSFNRAYAPWLFSKLKEGNEQTKYKIVRATYLYFVVIFGGVIVYGILVPHIIKLLVGKEFYGANEYIFWLSIASGFSGMYYMVGLFINYVNKNHLLALVTTVVALTNPFICFYLIRISGGVGAAQSCVIAQVMMFTFTWVMSARVYDMNWLGKTR